MSRTAYVCSLTLSPISKGIRAKVLTGHEYDPYTILAILAMAISCRIQTLLNYRLSKISERTRPYLEYG
jgi:hypothetical protein